MLSKLSIKASIWRTVLFLVERMIVASPDLPRLFLFPKLCKLTKLKTMRVTESYDHTEKLDPSPVSFTYLLQSWLREIVCLPLDDAT